MKKKISITINDNLLKNIGSLIDNINIRNRSHAIEHILRRFLAEEKTAVILAGGDEEKLKLSNGEYRLTTRVYNDTVLGLALRTLRRNNFRNIYLIARQNILTRVFSMFGDGRSYSVKLNYITESGSTGSFESLRHISNKIGTNFLVVYDDIIFDKVDIMDIWDSHLNSPFVATLMLSTSAMPSEKGNAVVQGNRIVKFIQKPNKSDNYIVFSPIFVTGPELFEYSGRSLEYHIFPELAKRGLLGGYVSSVKEKHVHSLS